MILLYPIFTPLLCIDYPTPNHISPAKQTVRQVYPTRLLAGPIIILCILMSHSAVTGCHKQERYPWWPVVVNEDPALFSDFLGRAISYTKKFNKPQLSFIASWNEWSEGHYLEPDKRFGTAWLEAIRKEKQDAV